MRRRSFLTGLLAAPVVITTPGLLMPVQDRTLRIIGKRLFLDKPLSADGYYRSLVVRNSTISYLNTQGILCPNDRFDMADFSHCTFIENWDRNHSDGLM